MFWTLLLDLNYFIVCFVDLWSGSSWSLPVSVCNIQSGWSALLLSSVCCTVITRRAVVTQAEVPRRRQRLLPFITTSPTCSYRPSPHGGDVAEGLMRKQNLLLDSFLCPQCTLRSQPQSATCAPTCSWQDRLYRDQVTPGVKSCHWYWFLPSLLFTPQPFCTAVINECQPFKYCTYISLHCVEDVAQCLFIPKQYKYLLQYFTSRKRTLINYQPIDRKWPT